MKNHKHHTILGVAMAVVGVAVAYVEPFWAIVAATGGVLIGQGITFQKFDPQSRNKEGN